MLNDPTEPLLLAPHALMRVAEALRESADAVARLAPHVAAEQQGVATLLRLLAAASPHVAAQPPQGVPDAAAPHDRPAPKHSGAALALRRATVASWMENRALTWPADRSPPSVADDIVAAAIELPGMPQQMIEDARWPPWRRPPGRPRKIRQK